ncbi:MAG TPA: multicopper oxidase domain-containing protein, partial [Polyangiaceae bacterium]|nr:multicopper oxidase domain-containing protein [Polyangiaceae bacterium]
MRPHRLRALCTVCALCASAGAAGMTFASCSSPTTEPTPDAGVPADVAASDAAAPSLQPPGWDQGLRMPALEDLNAAPGVVEVRLEAKVVPIAIGGQTLPMWTYQGILPGPVIRAKRGDRVLVHFTNSLPAPTTIHWHGLRVPNVMDGVPDVTQAPIPPGGTFDYEFRVPDAGTFWYHPHVALSIQVGYGLYGALVVDDPEGVAVVPPTDELTLVLSDVSITDAGAL